MCEPLQVWNQESPYYENHDMYETQTDYANQNLSEAQVWNADI